MIATLFRYTRLAIVPQQENVVAILLCQCYKEKDFKVNKISNSQISTLIIART